MKAAFFRRYGPPEVLEYGELPDPAPARGEVLVDIHAVSVNAADWKQRAGQYPAKVALPHIPGRDFSGVVAAVGEGARDFQPGDAVFGVCEVPAESAYAEKIALRQEIVGRKPERFSHVECAAAGLAALTALVSIEDTLQVKAGETVLIHGASGGVGVAATQIARANGLRVIATAGTERGMNLARQHGAHEVLNHRDGNYLNRVTPLTGGRGVDLVLEMLANVNLDRDLDVLAFRGRVMVVGNRGRIEIDPRKIMSKDGAILGMTMFNATADEYRTIHAALAPGLENGSLTPVIGREMPLDQAVQAHGAVMESGAFGKIVLVP